MARVLVVDDEPAVRRALERALRLDRYDVELAGDGEEALDMLAKSPPHAVIPHIATPRPPRSTTGSRASTSPPTIIWSSRSRYASFRRACAPCCDAPATEPTARS